MANRFRLRFHYTIEQANDQGQFEHFDGMDRTLDGLKRHQMKFIEGLLVEAANKMHAEGMIHPDVQAHVLVNGAKQLKAGNAHEDAMRHPVREPVAERAKGKK